ncbi:TPA: hypothetical protein RQK38_000516 [Vibrio vulnificus]|nr:hypothetical protein [Vibrio vulnificus]
MPRKLTKSQLKQEIQRNLSITSNIGIISANAGTGKSTMMVEHSVDYARNNKPVVILQETIDLINETESNLNEEIERVKAWNVSVHKFHSNTGRGTVYAQVTNHINKNRATAFNEILIMSREMFFQLRSEHYNLDGYICYHDEFLEAFVEKKLLTGWESKKSFEKLIAVKEQKHGVFETWDRVVGSDELEQIIEKNYNDYIINSLNEDGVLKLLLSSRAGYCDVYVSKNRKKLFALIRPEMFGCFREVFFLGAKYEYHEMHWFWSKWEAVMNKKIHIFDLASLGSKDHQLENTPSKANVELAYINDYRWSSDMKLKSHAISESIVSTLNAYYSGENYLLSEEKDVFKRCMFDLEMFEQHRYNHSVIRTGATLIGTKVAGINKYREDLNAAFLSPMSRSDEYYKAAIDLFLSYENTKGNVIITEDSINQVHLLQLHCNIAYYAYQFMFRTMIRQYDSAHCAKFFVGTRELAEVLVSMIDCDSPIALKRIRKRLEGDTDTSQCYSVRGSCKDILERCAKQERKEIKKFINKVKRQLNDWARKRKSLSENDKTALSSALSLITNSIKSIDQSSAVFEAALNDTKCVWELYRPDVEFPVFL